MRGKCERCCTEPANPVLCNSCDSAVKVEFQKLVEELLDADSRREKRRRTADI